MGEKTSKLAIEKAQNGFMVFIDDSYMERGHVRPLPYVFETMDGMFEFIKSKLN